MLLCTLVAWFVVRSRMTGRRLLDVLAFLPNTVPSIMIALAFVYLFLTVPWRLIPIYGTVWIIVIAVTTRYLAFGSRAMHGAVLQLHRDLEEAAQVGGVSWLNAMRYIVLPLLLPSAQCMDCTSPQAASHRERAAPPPDINHGAIP